MKKKLKYTFEGPLSPLDLEDFVRFLQHHGLIKNVEIYKKFKTCSFTFHCYYESLDGAPHIVEFEPPDYYQDRSVISLNRKKFDFTQRAKKEIDISFIPYFAQINNETKSLFFFGLDKIKEIDIKTSQKSGFFGDHVILPGDFCIEGARMFEGCLDLLKDFAPEAYLDVMESLFDKIDAADEFSKDLIYPDIEQRMENDLGEIESDGVFDQEDGNFLKSQPDSSNEGRSFLDRIGK